MLECDSRNYKNKNGEQVKEHKKVINNNQRLSVTCETIQLETASGTHDESELAISVKVL